MVQKMCKIATKYLNQEVENLNFLALKYNTELDGVFASVSIIHLSDTDLKKVLIKIDNSLKSEGILYCSFKFG